MNQFEHMNQRTCQALQEAEDAKQEAAHAGRLHLGAIGSAGRIEKELLSTRAVLWLAIEKLGGELAIDDEALLAMEGGAVRYEMFVTPDPTARRTMYHVRRR